MQATFPGRGRPLRAAVIAPLVAAAGAIIGHYSGLNAGTWRPGATAS